MAAEVESAASALAAAAAGADPSAHDLDGLALNIDVAPLIDVLKTLSGRLEALDAAARERHAEQQRVIDAQGQQIQQLLAEKDASAAAAAAAAASVTPDAMVSELLAEMVELAAEVGEKQVARKERERLFAHVNFLTSASADHERAASDLRADVRSLREAAEAAAEQEAAEFAAVRAELGTLQGAIEAASSGASGGLDELRERVLGIGNELDGVTASVAEAREAAAAVSEDLRQELERSATELSDRLARVEEVSGAMGDVHADLESRILGEASRLVESEAEARAAVERSVEESAAEAKAEMDKLAGVLGELSESQVAGRAEAAASIEAATGAVAERFATQLESVQHAVQEQIVSEVLEELSEPKLRPRLEQMGLELSGQSGALTQELVEKLEAEHRAEIEALQAKLANAVALSHAEVEEVATRLGLLQYNIASASDLDQLRGLVGTKAEEAEVQEILAELRALQESTVELAAEKRRVAAAPPPMQGVVQISPDGIPYLAAEPQADGSVRLTEGAAASGVGVGTEAMGPGGASVGTSPAPLRSSVGSSPMPQQHRASAHAGTSPAGAQRADAAAGASLARPPPQPQPQPPQQQQQQQQQPPPPRADAGVGGGAQLASTGVGGGAQLATTGVGGGPPLDAATGASPRAAAGARPAMADASTSGVASAVPTPRSDGGGGAAAAAAQRPLAVPGLASMRLDDRDDDVAMPAGSPARPVRSPMRPPPRARTPPEQAAGAVPAGAAAPPAAGPAAPGATGGVPLRLIGPDGQPLDWSELLSRPQTTGGGAGGAAASGNMSRDLAMLRNTVEEVRSAMKVKVDALALHRLRLQIAAHVENVQKALLDKIDEAEQKAKHAAPAGGGGWGSERPQARTTPYPPPQPQGAAAGGAAAGAPLSLDRTQAGALRDALAGHAKMQEMIVEQLAAHEKEIEDLKEMVGSFEGRGGLLARLHAQIAVLRRAMVEKADREEVNQRVLDTKKLEHDIRSRIERHVGELQQMLSATAGDTAQTRALLEERADLTKGYAEALFDGCIKAVAARVNNMQRTTHQQMAEQIMSIDEDIVRLERALPGVINYGRGGGAQQQRAAAAVRAPGTAYRRPQPRVYRAPGKQLFAWDMRAGGRPLPLEPVRRASVTAAAGPSVVGAGARRRSRDNNAAPAPRARSPPAALNPALPPPEKRVLPKLVVVGEQQAGGGAARASVPRAVAPTERPSYGMAGGTRTKPLGAAFWSSSAEPGMQASSLRTGAAGGRR